MGGIAGRREIADEFAEWALLGRLVGKDMALEHDLGVGGDQEILRHGLRHRQGPAAESAGRRELVGIFRHLRAHGGGRELKRQIGPDAYDDRQRHAHPLGPLEGETQVASVVELDGGAVGTDELQPMIGGVVDSGLGIANDDDAGSDETARILGGMKQDGQQAREIDVVGMNSLLRGRVGDPDGRDRRRECPADGVADAAKPDPEGGLAILLAAQHISDDRRGVTVHGGEQNGRSAVAFFQHGRNREVGIDRRRIGFQPALRDHAVDRRAKSCVEDAGVRHEGPFCRAARAGAARSLRRAILLWPP